MSDRNHKSQALVSLSVLQHIAWLDAQPYGFYLLRCLQNFMHTYLLLGFVDCQLIRGSDRGANPGVWQ